MGDEFSVFFSSCSHGDFFWRGNIFCYVFAPFLSPCCFSSLRILLSALGPCATLGLV